MIATSRRKKKSAPATSAGSAQARLTATPAPTANPEQSGDTLDAGPAPDPAMAATPEREPSVPAKERVKNKEGGGGKAKRTGAADSPAPAAAHGQETSQEHGRHVAFLADRLFDGLLPLHGLGKSWKRRLHLAALLHDIGFAEGREKHHKISMRMIEEDTTLDLTDKDRPLVALLARYHRKAWPSLKHRRYAALSGKKRDALTKAAALLRVADGLDYRHLGVVRDVSVELTETAVRLWLRADGESTAECARAVKKGDLLEDLFQKKLECLCPEDA